LHRSDPENWLELSGLKTAELLIRQNDAEFKYYLDRYKYAERYPQQSQTAYRQQGETFILELEKRLQQQCYLSSRHFALADAAILPFIRQFAAVEPQWFQNAPYRHVQNWLNQFCASGRFQTIMQKYPLWQPGTAACRFPDC
jgi:glutathione S-transferase